MATLEYQQNVIIIIIIIIVIATLEYQHIVVVESVVVVVVTPKNRNRGNLVLKEGTIISLKNIRMKSHMTNNIIHIKGNLSKTTPSSASASK